MKQFNLYAAMFNLRGATDEELDHLADVGVPVFDHERAARIAEGAAAEREWRARPAEVKAAENAARDDALAAALERARRIEAMPEGSQP